jgi:hypothetical protein
MGGTGGLGDTRGVDDKSLRLGLRPQNLASANADHVQDHVSLLLACNTGQIHD